MERQCSEIQAQRGARSSIQGNTICRKPYFLIALLSAAGLNVELSNLRSYFMYM